MEVRIVIRVGRFSDEDKNENFKTAGLSRRDGERKQLDGK